MATTDPERRAAYLRHAVDEARHAQLFAARARELAGVPLVLRADGEDLYARLGEQRFLAFVHHAEGRGLAEFSHYARAFDAAGDGQTARLFREVSRDEIQHQRYSLKLLESVSGSPGVARRAVLLVRGWELWRSARRGGSRLAMAVYLVLMAAIYLLLAPLWLWLGWRRRRGLVPTGAADGGDSLPTPKPTDQRVSQEVS